MAFSTIKLPPIQFKRSAVPGKVPTDSDLLIGEIAINTADRIIYYKDSEVGSVRKLSTALIRNLDDVSDSDIYHGYTLIWDSDVGQFTFGKSSAAGKLLDLEDVTDSDRAGEHGNVLSWDSDGNTFTFRKVPSYDRGTFPDNLVPLPQDSLLLASDQTSRLDDIDSDVAKLDTAGNLWVQGRLIDTATITNSVDTRILWNNLFTSHYIGCDSDSYLSYDGGIWTNISGKTLVVDFSATTLFPTNDTGIRYIAALLEGTRWRANWRTADGTNSCTADVAGVLVLQNNETFEFQVWQNSGGNLIIGGAANVNNVILTIRGQ